MVPEQGKDVELMSSLVGSNRKEIDPKVKGYKERYKRQLFISKNQNHGTK